MTYFSIFTVQVKIFFIMETCSFKTNARLLLFSKNLTQPYDVEGNIFFGKRAISEVQQWF